ncbi:Glutathione S-transferase 2 [Steccherinum ochraceum]|uniref:Glutathione S-transferase 2 n=1 Tax=Steccherinum ochraceum TaxID=92696 RepID=A0A4V2MW05_9APHY|nr:Glutathione S-transferase 2 [Steccherinum ochraceum]
MKSGRSPPRSAHYQLLPLYHLNTTSPHKDFTLYSTKPSPSGWKVAVIMEELGLNYDTIWIPVLVDHLNADFVIWDSSAIMLYLIERYDKEGKITVQSAAEKAVMMQWLFYQSSSQGPMFSQLFYFGWRLPERMPTAIKRYQDELIRIFAVLEGVLKKAKEDGKDWLVGDKLTVVDLSFVIWNHFAPFLMSTYERTFAISQDYPHVFAWHKRMTERPGVKRILEQHAEYNDSFAALSAMWK